MAGIQDEVGLLQGQRVGLGTRPLLQHLVADAPHQDARMVTVAQHQVSQVALVPLVEEAGVVVLRLAATPHVERLIHDDKAHGVAHVQQFRGWRVMAGTDGIDTHCLQFYELAVQGVLMQGSA